MRSKHSQKPGLFILPIILITTSEEHRADKTTKKGAHAKLLGIIQIKEMSTDTGVAEEAIITAFERLIDHAQLNAAKKKTREIQKIISSSTKDLAAKGKDLLDMYRSLSEDESEAKNNILRNLAKIFYAKTDWYKQKKGHSFISSVTHYIGKEAIKAQSSGLREFKNLLTTTK